MIDDYLQCMSAIFGSEEIELYRRVFVLVEQVELEQYQQTFEEIIAAADDLDSVTVRDRWHDACHRLVIIMLKAFGIFPSSTAELVTLVSVLEYVLEIEHREDKYGLYDILMDVDAEPKEQFIATLGYFFPVDDVELAMSIDRVHNGCILALRKIALSDSDPYADIDTQEKLPPLVKNVRLLIDDNPNFKMLALIKAGLRMGEDVRYYVKEYWSLIMSEPETDVLRELCAMVLCSNTPPHEMLATLRALIGEQYQDLAMQRKLNSIVTERFGSILIQKV